MDGHLYITLRVLHILLAALWVGALFVMSVFVFPAIGEAGASGDSFLLSLTRRKIHVFMASTAGLTVLSGLWLYWLFTAGFARAAVSSPQGLAFGIGGLCGLLAAVIGGSVVGRGVSQVVAHIEQNAALPDGERGAHMQSLRVLRKRIGIAGRIVLLLVIAALILMSLGHYL
jgi:hypothetical protein